MLVAEPGRQATASFLERADAVADGDLEAGFGPLIEQVTEELGSEGVAAGDLVIEQWIDCRYAGQSATLELSRQDPAALADAFHAAHERAFGHRLDRPVELVGLRVEARGRPRVDRVPAESVSGDVHGNEAADPPELPRAALAGREIAGPAIVTDRDATTWVAAGWSARLDPHGHLLLTR
jgi:N-methylhydantoinase A